MELVGILLVIFCFSTVADVWSRIGLIFDGLLLVLVGTGFDDMFCTV